MLDLIWWKKTGHWLSNERPKAMSCMEAVLLNLMSFSMPLHVQVGRFGCLMDVPVSSVPLHYISGMSRWSLQRLLWNQCGNRNRYVVLGQIRVVFFSPTQLLLPETSVQQICQRKLMQCADKTTGQNSPLPPITIHYVHKMWSVYSSLDM